jgi:hypothetical protein
MATTGLGVFAVLFALLSGGANDLLDFVPSDAYWRAKQVTVSVDALAAELNVEPPADVAKLIRGLGESDFARREEAARRIRATGPAAIPALEKAVDDADPEVVSRVRTLIGEIRQASRGAAVRRLLAIRTLGEMKDARALAALRPLLASTEPFVADYAGRAVAQIEGKALPVRGASAEALRADLSLLPANCGAVAQVSFGGSAPVSIDKALKDVPAEPGEDRRATLDALTAGVIGVAEKVGNVRVEAVTLGVADDVGDREGFVVAVVRGRWDAQAVREVVRPIFPTWKTVDGVEVAMPHATGALAMPSDERLIAWAGPVEEKMPIQAVLAAAREGKGPLLGNAEMAKLIGAVDPKAAAWAVCRVTPAYRAAPVLGQFETVTLTAVRERGGMNVKVSGVGADAGAVKNAVDMVNKQLVTAKMEVPKLAEQVPTLKPVAEFVKSMACEADGVRATLTGRFEGEPASLLAVPMGLVGHRAQVVPPPQPQQPAGAARGQQQRQGAGQIEGGKK